jgi:hypothetical protein
MFFYAILVRFILRRHKKDYQRRCRDDDEDCDQDRGKKEEDQGPRLITGGDDEEMAAGRHDQIEDKQGSEENMEWRLQIIKVDVLWGFRQKLGWTARFGRIVSLISCVCSEAEEMQENSSKNVR